MRDCSFAGKLLLAEAQIQTVDLSGSVLEELDGTAAEVSGSLILQGCAARAVDLDVAHIGGQLSLSGAKLANPGGRALHADRMTVSGGMYCQDGFQAEGEIWLLGAHIGGPLDLSGAKLANPGGRALTADRMTVSGGMFCQDGFQAEGEIRLAGAHISAALDLSGAKLANPGGTALTADRMSVDGGMFCQDGFQAEGEIRLAGAHISAALDLSGAKLANVDLTSAQVRVLYDNPDRWPPQMRIDGFTYQSLQPYARARGISGRLAWLARAEPEYRAQPYEHLAAYYRRLGHDDEARRVLLAKQRRRRSTLGPIGKTTGYLLDGIVGYGYQPGRAFAWLVVLLVTGSVYFTYNQPAPLDPAQHLHYQPVLYTADQLIPLVNLSQANVWAPAGISQWITFALVVLGWVLATAIVAGVTRVLARV
jgi:hypothetical protein